MRRSYGDSDQQCLPPWFQAWLPWWPMVPGNSVRLRSSLEYFYWLDYVCHPGQFCNSATFPLQNCCKSRTCSREDMRTALPSGPGLITWRHFTGGGQWRVCKREHLTVTSHGFPSLGHWLGQTPLELPVQGLDDAYWIVLICIHSKELAKNPSDF